MNKSHFSSQLLRQRQLSRSNIPALEIFMCHDSPGTSFNNFDLLGSSFITHDIAENYRNKVLNPKTERWRKADIISLANNQFSQTGNVSLKYFISEILNCRIGEKYLINRKTRAARIRIGRKKIDFLYRQKKTT
jgi:hypothetical protein